MNTATIYSYSVVYMSSVDFQDKTPYLCAILEADDNTRFASLVEGYVEGSEIKIGQQVYAKKTLDATGTMVYSLLSPGA